MDRQVPAHRCFDWPTDHELVAARHARARLIWQALADWLFDLRFSRGKERPQWNT